MDNIKHISTLSSLRVEKGVEGEGRKENSVKNISAADTLFHFCGITTYLAEGYTWIFQASHSSL